MNTMHEELPFLDIFAPDFTFDSAAFEETRREFPMVRTPIGYMVLGYDDCVSLLKDARLAQGSAAMLAMRGVTSGPLVDWWKATMLNVDGEAHTRLRRLVAKAFTPPSVEQLRPKFRATAQHLIARFPSDGRVEFMEAFAEPYPLQGICEMLGIAPQDREQFAGFANDLAHFFSASIGSPDVYERATTALAGLNACADTLIADRRKNPGTDLVSAMVAAEADGDRLSETELRTMIVGLIFAGNDTTRNQLGLMMAKFANDEPRWNLLRTRPEVAATAVEELMRLHPTIAAVPRIVREAMSICGIDVEAGRFVTLAFASANTDERIYGEKSYDLAAERPQQLTFSGGIHRCLGMWLARAELQEALVELSKLGRVVFDGAPTWPKPLGIYGPKKLPLRFGR